MRFAAAYLLLMLVTGACGYRPVGGTLPGGHRSVKVELPVPARTDEPALGPALAAALCRELARAGIRASTAGRAPAILRSSVLRVGRSRPLLARGGRAVAAHDLALRVELALLDARTGRVLWRSGLVEVESSAPLSGEDPLRAEAARRRVLERLASEAARRGVTLLTTAGDGP